MATDEDASQSYTEHQIVHYQQRYNWDCGVSCVLMLLPEEDRNAFLEHFTEICEEEGFYHSTWTIDLCYLLKRFNIEHEMCTIMPGVNENYKKFGYYNKIIEMDRDRIRRRFASAAGAGLQVSRRPLSCAALGAHVATRGPAIVLVDAGLLVCDLCKHNKLKAEFRRCFGGGYRGHYIVVVGRSRGKLLFRDPALRPRVCAAAPRALARARRARGTDHDVILVYKDFRCLGG